MQLESLDRPLHRRVAGRGPLVVCLHASGGSSSQWEPLIEAADDRYSFAAFDLCGHGRSAAFHDRPYRLTTESRAVLRTIAHATGPIHLVGHSYGGAVALDLAMRLGDAVASVTVYEPVLFGLLDDDSDDHREITAVGRAVVVAAAAGRLEEAACSFIDYWSGAGTWSALPDGARQRIVARMPMVAAHFEALSANPVPIARLRPLRAPTRLLHGDASPRPVLTVARRLAAVPAIESECIVGAGHMGPLTHARDIVARIVAHLDAHRGTGAALQVAA